MLLTEEYDINILQKIFIVTEKASTIVGTSANLRYKD